MRTNWDWGREPVDTTDTEFDRKAAELLQKIDEKDRMWADARMFVQRHIELEASIEADAKERNHEAA